MDPVSTNFPKMGKTTASPRNISGKGSPNTKAVPRANTAGGALESVLAPSRRHTAERLGSVGMPQTSHAPQTDPSASATLRNTRMLPAVMRYVEPFDDYSKDQWT